VSIELAAFLAAMQVPNLPPAVIVTNPILELSGVSKCPCGCNQPAGIVVSIGSARVFINSPAMAYAIGDALAAHRQILWGPR
jgi:hypothetical protein